MKRSHEKQLYCTADFVDESAEKLKLGIEVYAPKATGLINGTLMLEYKLKAIFNKKSFKSIKETRISMLSYMHFCQEVQA